MDQKKQYGQFFTKNYEYILQNLSIPENINKIIEPFAGEKDLIKWVQNKDKYEIICFDIDPKDSSTIERDTLKNPPNMKNSFILTNPPYLSRNKNIDKTIYDLYDVNDLYKCFLKIIINQEVLGGIIIIPLNFLCSIRKSDINIREAFFNKYIIQQLNIFEEQVFKDTSYTICSFQFKLKEIEEIIDSLSLNIQKDVIINTIIYPHNKNILLKINKSNNYTIGGEIYNLPLNNKYTITRIIKKNKNSEFRTNLKIRCIDNPDDKIKCTVVEDDDIYIDNTINNSSRTFISLIIEPKLSIDEQHELCNKFNTFLNNKRDLYHSLFLTNYRESKKETSRKRISFQLVYNIFNHLLLDK